MKFVKRTAQAFASIVVLSLLLSGSVFAYSTRLSHISSLASPSPLDDDKSSSTTTEHKDKSSTTTSSTTTEHEDKSSTATSTEHEDESSTTIMTTEHEDKSSTATSSTTTEHEDKSSTATSTEREDESSTTIMTTEHEDKSSTTTTEHDKNEVNQVNAKEEGKTDEEDINKAKDSKQIPAVVEVSGSGSTITQIDSKFSVSVSRPSDISLSVSIAGANGTGPRVLLIDISKDAGGLSSLGSLNVTYDGEKVSQASSLSQVLSGTSTSPPSYIVLLTSSGAHLLVFIPHFSSHLIGLQAGFAPFGALTAVAPLTLGGLAEKCGMKTSR